MANYEQAPILCFEGNKTQNNITNQSYIIPQRLADIIFDQLGNASAQLRIMLVLCGTKEGFSISEKWILDRTGLLHSSYIKARQALIQREWLTLTDTRQIIVNYDNIYRSGNTALPQSSNTIIQQESNTIIPQERNTTLPIINNRIDNKQNNLIDSQKSSAGSSFVF